MIFLRVQSHYRERLTEWQNALLMLGWGFITALPFPTFLTSASYGAFDGINETVLGLAVFALGAFRITGLVINGARQKVTPWMRLAGAGSGFCLFFGLAISFAFAGNYNTGSWLYAVLAAVEAFNVFAASKDTGVDEHGTPGTH